MHLISELNRNLQFSLNFIWW